MRLDWPATVYPAVWDVESTFGKVFADASVFLAPGGSWQPTLVLAAGGQKVFGDRPFFESAFLGGPRAPRTLRSPAGQGAVRGLRPQRYAGDASLYGNADLFLPITRASFLGIPLQFGVQGFARRGPRLPGGRILGQVAHGLRGRAVLLLSRPSQPVHLLPRLERGPHGLLLRSRPGVLIAWGSRDCSRPWRRRPPPGTTRSPRRLRRASWRWTRGSRAPSGSALTFDDGMGAFVDRFEVERGPEWTAIEPNGDLFVVPACERGPCRVRYRVRLQEAARTLDRRGDRPRERRRPAGPAFVLAGPADARPAPGTLSLLGLAAGRRVLRHRRVPGRRLLGHVRGRHRGPRGGSLLRVRPARPRARVARRAGSWTSRSRRPSGPCRSRRSSTGSERSARAVAGYYGTFPVARAQVIVLPGGRRPVGFGTTLGNGGASIIVWLGRGATRAHLERDWVLVHEMTHLGFPNVPRAQHWMEEGLATYVEPIARARAGILADAEVWRGLVQGLPNGQPRAGENGFDRTRRWGALYWGGALFWFLADLEIRERTGGRRSRGRRAARDPRGGRYHCGALAASPHAGDGRPRDRDGRPAEALRAARPGRIGAGGPGRDVEAARRASRWRTACASTTTRRWRRVRRAITVGREETAAGRTE